MINFRIIARVFSLLLIFEGLFMLVTAAVSQLYMERAAASFFYSALITIITGVTVFTPLRNEERVYGYKEGYIIVTGTWILFTLFGTLPFILSGSIDSFSDAFFESMSGFTTTGATILNDIESMPKGILFWRSLTQWLGGIGIIFISLSIFPVVKSINIQLAATEFAGQSTDKIHPRIREAAKRLIAVYIIITLAESLLLIAGGMSIFDAVCHSFSTLSTGGFSTHSNSFSSFATPYLMIITILFMFLAGTNMTLVYFGVTGNFRKVISNNEFVFYSLLCIGFIVIVSAVLLVNKTYSPGNSLLNGAFQAVSIITTTGFYTQNYSLWGNLMAVLLLLLMFTGGTAGSASGSIKIVRLLLITKNNRQELIRLIHPNAFIPVRLNKHVISQTNVYNLLIFTLLYFIIICIGTLVISFMNYDLLTSFSTSASMLGNIGPGIGSFGPFTDYASMPAAGKWFLSGLMLLGRLELLTVILLFTRSFYRR